ALWCRVMAADKDHTRTHMTIAVPGATTQSMGLPDNNKQGGVWMMNAGTTTAHLITAGEYGARNALERPLLCGVGRSGRHADVHRHHHGQHLRQGRSFPN